MAIHSLVGQAAGRVTQYVVVKVEVTVLVTVVVGSGVHSRKEEVSVTAALCSKLAWMERGPCFGWG